MIEQLDSRIAETTRSIQEFEEASLDPQDFAASLTLASLRSHLDDLIEQKRQLLQAHQKEIVELRLKGADVNQGTVPLRFLSALIEEIALSLQAAAYHLHSGSDPKRIPKWIQESLNLRFVDVVPGSSRVLIEGDTSPDLFGNSLLRQTLESLFRLLQSDSDDKVFDEVDELGVKSLKNLYEIFSASLRHRVEFDLHWSSLEATPRRWHADRDKLKLWQNRIKHIQSRPLSDLSVTAEVSLLSLTGRIELLSEDTGKISAMYPRTLYDEIRQLHIGDTIYATIGRRQIIDVSRGVNRITYAVKSVDGAEQSA
jgi:hypothetical protein